MKLMLLTSPGSLPMESETVNELFIAGLETLHLRKPGCTEEEMRKWIEAIEPSNYNRIMIHSHHWLVAQYGLCGGHFPRKTRQGQQQFNCPQVSTSCHSIEEARTLEDQYDYFMISPVFDSISKPGYFSAFELEELQEATHSLGNLVALGGVSRENINLLKKIPCYGAAVLGAVWCWKSVSSRLKAFLDLRQVLES